MGPELEEAQALIEYQHTVIKTQSTRIDKAIDLLEDLVIDEDVDPEKVEQIIKVLMDG